MSGVPNNDDDVHAWADRQLSPERREVFEHAMARDPLGFLTLYAWEASLPATIS